MTILLAGFAVGAAAMIAVKRGQTGKAQQGGERAGVSSVGILVQAIGFVLASGPVRMAGGLVEGMASPRTWLTALLVAASLALVVSSFRTMGEEWALVARTRAEHRLVTNGPFALVRNPIYLGLLLYLVALAVATGHERMLVPGLLCYALGTAIRVRAEEKLLRARFGEEYAAYAARVKRIIPGLV